MLVIKIKIDILQNKVTILESRMKERQKMETKEHADDTKLKNYKESSKSEVDYTTSTNDVTIVSEENEKNPHKAEILNARKKIGIYPVMPFHIAKFAQN